MCLVFSEDEPEATNDIEISVSHRETHNNNENNNKKSRTDGRNRGSDCGTVDGKAAVGSAGSTGNN